VAIDNDDGTFGALDNATAQHIGDPSRRTRRTSAPHRTGRPRRTKRARRTRCNDVP
jgi:hypothetical protein